MGDGQLHSLARYESLLYGDFPIPLIIDMALRTDVWILVFVIHLTRPMSFRARLLLASATIRLSREVFKLTLRIIYQYYWHDITSAGEPNSVQPHEKFPPLASSVSHG